MSRSASRSSSHSSGSNRADKDLDERHQPEASTSAKTLDDAEDDVDDLEGDEADDDSVEGQNDGTEAAASDDDDDHAGAKSDDHDGTDGQAPQDGDDETPATFASLGLIPQICEACELLKFKAPTGIQKETIPYALQGRDIIGLAQTGSGKTAAFALPIIQSLYDNPQPLFACVLAPTRELAYQISEQFTALGVTIGVRCAVIVGGMDMMQQSIALSKRPHIVVATPGRLQDHLENTKGFSLRSLKYLVRSLVLFMCFVSNAWTAGPRRGGSPTRHGLRPRNRQDSQSNPSRTTHLPLFRYDDDKSRKATKSIPHESRQARSLL